MNFVQQYSQADLKQKFPLYTACTVDNTTLRGIGDDAVGLIRSSFRSEDSDNPVNKRFVADFQKKYGRAAAEYAVQGYGAIMLIDSSVHAVQGRVEDRDAFAAPLKRADFKSVRGNFRLNTNGFPIQDYYVGRIVKEGDRVRVKPKGAVPKDHGDA